MRSTNVVTLTDSYVARTKVLPAVTVANDGTSLIVFNIYKLHIT